MISRQPELSYPADFNQPPKTFGSHLLAPRAQIGLADADSLIDKGMISLSHGLWIAVVVIPLTCPLSAGLMPSWNNLWKIRLVTLRAFLGLLHP